MAGFPENTASDDEEMRSEYDFRSMQGVVRGKYASRYSAQIRVVRLADDVAAAFPDEAAVNQALREYLRDHAPASSDL